MQEIGKNNLVVYTFGTNKPENVETRVVELGIKLKSGFTMNMIANVVPTITGKIQRLPITMKMRENLKNYELADLLPDERESTFIDLLVGNDYYADIVSLQRITLHEGLYLLQSKLGWILSGRVKECASARENYSLTMFTCSASKLAKQIMSFSDIDESVDVKPKLEDFWQLDTIGIKDCPVENDDEKALMKFNENVTFESGRYYVRWPWRDDNPDLPDNYHLAYGRLKSNLKRLRENHRIL